MSPQKYPFLWAQDLDRLLTDTAVSDDVQLICTAPCHRETATSASATCSINIIIHTETTMALLLLLLLTFTMTTTITADNHNHADDVVLMPTNYGVPVLASPPGRRRE